MPCGIIFLNKQSGITSFDALRDIKRALGTGKVGHTGTLDKFARGLLIVLCGRALKLSRWFTHCDKKYTGRIHFGIETDTLDPEGKEIASAPLPSREKAENALSQFTGSFMQEPPVFSAIHVNGKRASNLVRSGQIPEMKKRPVTIYKLELIGWDPPFADILVHCSGGTYIRSLARDIAKTAGSRGHLASLLRTEIAGFTLETPGSEAESCKYGTENEKRNEQLAVFPVDKSVISRLGIPWFEATGQEAEAVSQGKPLDRILDDKTFINPSYHTLYSTPHIAVFCRETLIAVIEKTDNKWKYGCVI